MKKKLADLPGLVCEQHPDVPWPHGDCPGPGMLPQAETRSQ